MFCCAQVTDSECAPTFEDHVAVDSTRPVASELFEKGIVTTAKTHDGARDDKQEENISEEKGPPPDQITSREAMTAIDILRWYLQTIETDESVFEKLFTLESIVAGSTGKMQAPIEDFFKPQRWPFPTDNL